MKKFFGFCITFMVMFGCIGTAQAQGDNSPMSYLKNEFPDLTTLFEEELSKYNAHYIFAVDVSGSMKKYEQTVANALTPFFKALPDGDRVHIIPFGTDAKTSVLGYAGVIDQGVKNTLCTNIKTLYTNGSYTRDFVQYTDIHNAVDGISNVIQSNRNYKVNVVVIITDFRNDQKGKGERKFNDAELAEMKEAISAATGDVYTRFIALRLPVEQSKPGYCLDQLSEKVFSFNDNSLEIAPIDNDQSVIKQWFEQLEREIMVTKLKAIVHNANKNTPISLKTTKDIDGNVVANIEWTPSKLYPKIKIDSTFVDCPDFRFINNTENFTVTSKSPISVELGQIKHKSWGFHTFDGNIHLGLQLPTEYDDELARLSVKKPIPETVVEEKGTVFTFILTLRTTLIILAIIILYIIGVIRAIIRNRKLCFQANVTLFDKNGTQIGDLIRIPKQSPSAKLAFGKGGTGHCKVDDAAWQFTVSKKNGNPFLLFVKPRFVWKKTGGYVVSGKKQQGTLTDSLRVSCGNGPSDITHSMRIKLKQ